MLVAVVVVVEVDCGMWKKRSPRSLVEMTSPAVARVRLLPHGLQSERFVDHQLGGEERRGEGRKREGMDELNHRPIVS